MGLDCTAYSHMKPTDEVLPLDERGLPDYSGCSDEWWDVLYNADRRVIFAEPGQQHAIEGMEAGRIYEMTEETEAHGFRAGSYGGYNAFRTALCQHAVGVDPRVVWASPRAFVDKPFYELVNFSDCEGVMGTIASANLHQDFLAGRDAFVGAMEALGEDGAYFVEKYDDWVRATELAAQDGIIVFH